MGVNKQAVSFLVLMLPCSLVMLTRCTVGLQVNEMDRPALLPPSAVGAERLLHSERPKEPRLAYVQKFQKEDCPDYDAALRKVQQVAGCGDGWPQRVATNPCTQRIDECGGCDICPFIAAGAGPDLSLNEHWISGEDEGRTSPDETHPAQIGKWLCDGKHKSLLAGTILHEALHLCPGWQGAGKDIKYGWPLSTAIGSGCTTYGIEGTCMGVWH